MTSTHTHIRKYALLSLTKLEQRDNRDLTPERISDRIRDAFRCVVCVVVAQAKTTDAIHIGIFNTGISKNVGQIQIKKLFTECNCSVKFFKGLGSFCDFLIKEDKEPFVRGEYFSSTCIKEIALQYKLHKKISYSFRDLVSVKKKKETEADPYTRKRVPFVPKKAAVLKKKTLLDFLFLMEG